MADNYYRVYVQGKQVGAYTVRDTAYQEGWKLYNAGNTDTYLTTPEGWLYTYSKHPDENPNPPQPQTTTSRGVGVVNQQPVILQTAPVEYSAWGAGPYANQRFVHVELCMYDDPTTFSMAYDAYSSILTKILYDRGLGVTPAKSSGTGTLWAHADVTRILGGPAPFLERRHPGRWGRKVIQATNDFKVSISAEENVLYLQQLLSTA